jgi:hypothetical protein
MKTPIATLAAVALMLALSSSAHAANFCVSFGSAHIVASGLVLPAKGTCTSFNGFYTNKNGLLLAGEVCKSSNGTTFLFNTFTQFNSQLPDSLVGKWTAASGKGTGTECTSAACNSFTVTVTKCSNVTISGDLSGFDAPGTQPFLTTEEH